MVRKIYNYKKTISVKQFISEFGENFSEKMKKRLLDLEIRCVLTRKEEANILDIKHVEHIQHEVACDEEDTSSICQKEYSYGQFIVVENELYFSERSAENTKVVQEPIVDTIYNSLSSEERNIEEDCNAKKIDDSNIDFIIDSILTVCPEVSQAYLDIIKHMNSLRSR